MKYIVRGLKRIIVLEQIIQRLIINTEHNYVVDYK